MEATTIPQEELEEINKTQGFELASSTPEEASNRCIAYDVEDIPPWYQCLLFGLQHFLVIAGGSIPLIALMTSLICMEDTDPGRGDVVSTYLFVSGLATLLQSTLGIRLPIIQGVNFAYVVPSIIILDSFPPCHSLNMSNMTEAAQQEEWQSRMRYLQGAVAVSSVVQVVIGATGVVGMLMTWVTPLTLVPTITLLGLSLFSVGTEQASSHWGISSVTLIMLVVVSQFMKDVKMPLPAYTKAKGFHWRWALIFTYFPVLIVMCIAWAVCGMLTVLGLFPEGSPARTDLSGALINSNWFRVPYPGQWGLPMVSVSGVLGMIAAVIANIIESIGDYNACATVCGVPPPPVHAINRAVCCEGLGGVIFGLYGTGGGTASITGNIALIGITKAGCRRAVQVCGLLMLVTGMFSKCCAVLSSIPKPVLGSTLMFYFALITSIGLSNLRFVDLQSPRNLFVLGFSIFMGLAIPEWLMRNPEAIQTGSPVVDQSLTSLLQTSMFVGGILGLILDNLIPGTRQERGLNRHSYYRDSTGTHQDPETAAASCYDLPFGMKALSRWKWPRFVPVCPMFRRPRQEQVAVVSEFV